MPADLGMKDNFVVRMEDFKERFKTQIQSNTTPNSTNVKPTQTPATPSTPPQSNNPNRKRLKMTLTKT